MPVCWCPRPRNTRAPIRAVKIASYTEGEERVLDTVASEDAIRLAIALGIGLLVGVERERRMAERGRRGTAGVRTFALVALLGGVAEQVGGVPLLAVALAFVVAATLIGYFREPSELGITTEVALVVTFLLGVLAQREPTLASGLAVLVTILLATRSRLHYFVSSVLSAEEMHDALLLAACALVVLPLLPDRTVDPLDVLNPFAVWRLIVLLMAISSAGYVAVRVIGPRYGLAVAGLLGGFVSSTVTIGAMGTRSRGQPKILRSAISGALFSTVATIVQMAAVLAVISPATLREIAWALVLAGVGAAVVAGLTLVGAPGSAAQEPVKYGRAFDLRAAVLLGFTVTAITVVSAAAGDAAGESGVQLAAFLGGFADAHAAAIGVAAVVAAGKLSVSAAAIGVLAALSANTLSKLAFAYIGGGPRFALPVTAGLLTTLALAWLGALLASA